MDRADALAKYQKMGLVTEEGVDAPNRHYPPHRHETTYLFTVAGSLCVSRDGGQLWRELIAGSELIVHYDELHEAIVGPEGWEYVAAWDEAEAAKYKDSH